MKKCILRMHFIPLPTICCGSRPRDRSPTGIKASPVAARGIKCIARKCILFLLALAFTPALVQAGIDSIAIAKAVAADKFASFTYGGDIQKKQINCVQFIGEVVSRLLGRPLIEAEIDAIYIKTKFDDLNLAVDAGDGKTKGVLYAFTKVLKCGREVRHEDARAGDFVQYWIKKKNGKWMGHSSILAKVWKGADGVNRAAIYGANQSTNGIAETAFKGNEGLRLNGADRRVYIVRFELPQ